ncbi:hypothetical protein [Shouchella clausii]|uniref:hypothetical protein n=1 Tax=Shouchella clausii TaxID=79880 RepID=UPI00115510D0|nr:hypothetical protein [Shouchella clausii]MBU8594944.1 hypothetical protein [Shouchella clausii]MCM3550603.1 hypothetical protein [Shouchella clausii]MCR1286177.1 hypothetical protein [Shouchella clausii]MCY1105739.1 hypothetical protein [Shouchella clausii]MEB5472639.1 hypothetical protein [Shouchella clausii]
MLRKQDMGLVGGGILTVLFIFSSLVWPGEQEKDENKKHEQQIMQEQIVETTSIDRVFLIDN